MMIFDAVGKGCKNLSSDVSKIQTLLNANPIIVEKLVVDGKYGQRTFQAILKYQMSIFHRIDTADGVINSRGKTLESLNNPRREPIRTVSEAEVKARALALGGNAPAPIRPATSASGKLTDTDYQSAARMLGDNIEVAMLKAIAEVESGGRSGFSATGFPKIAYEGHVFRKLTARRHDTAHPQLSYRYVIKAGPEWKKNNKDDATAQETLKAAVLLDRAAAYQACSWGMFQVMGFNYQKCGFSSVEVFVESMKAGELGQLKAFVGFCKNTPGMTAALANKSFVQCAKLYNGDDYGDYDKRIGKAYRKYSNV